MNPISNLPIEIVECHGFEIFHFPNYSTSDMRHIMEVGLGLGDASGSCNAWEASGLAARLCSWLFIMGFDHYGFDDFRVVSASTKY